MRRKRRKEAPNKRKGVTFLGNIVTAGSKAGMLDDFRNRYIAIAKKRIEDPEDNFEERTDDALNEEADKYARAELQKQILHYKSFLKGKKTYKYLGRIHPVSTDEFLRLQLKNSPQEPVDVKLPNESTDEEE